MQYYKFESLKYLYMSPYNASKEGIYNLTLYLKRLKRQCSLETRTSVSERWVPQNFISYLSHSSHWKLHLTLNW